VTGAVRERWGLPVRFAATQLQAGMVRNGYHDFRQLGVDRWLAIIAAVDQIAGSVCIVDAGTAITIDAVAAGGAHLGGYIIPGLDLMRLSLDEETGDLRRLAGEKFQELPAGLPALGHSTAEAIGGGTLAAVCGLIDRCVGALLCERDAVPALVVTGGNAERLLRHLDMTAHHRPQLVLEGLKLYEFDESAERAES
jgi:type III pantothenate kinase